MTGNRRQFLRQAAIAGAAIGLENHSARAGGRSRLDRLNVGIVGVANRGGDNLGELARLPDVNIVALCDVDDNYLGAAATRFPRASTYSDYRRLLAQKDIDAVVVSTPDHTHAPIGLAAMQTGRDLYCEKPLAHTVAEVRRMTETAVRLKRVTQMGTQIHATNNYRRVVELIRSGIIGTVRAAHCWADKVWTGITPLPASDPQPATLHWDLWLGQSKPRPYNACYAPAKWRGWWEWGGGTLADMACHHVDLPFWALNLDHPLTIEGQGPAVDLDIAPAWQIVHYTFGARDKRAPVALTWYSGGKRPPQFDTPGMLPRWGDGTLFVGDKGMLLSDYGRHILLPQKDFADYAPPTPYLPDSIGHHAEWVAACKSGEPTTCSFDYSGPLAETVALGNVAYRVGAKLHWDARKMRTLHNPEADALLYPDSDKQDRTPRKTFAVGA